MQKQNVSTRVREHRVAIGDIVVSYSEAGEGDSVVFVHGLAEDRKSWARQQESLTAWRTFAPDLRGHGGSSLGSGLGTVQQLTNDLVTFLEEVSGPTVLVGFSLGGTLVLTAAAERPDLVRGVVVLGTSSVVGRGAAAFYEDRIEAMRHAEPETRARILMEDTKPAIVAATDQLERVVKTRVAAIGDGAGYINAALAMASLNEDPLTPRLSQIKQHVDVVGADRDTFCPRKAADIMLEALPNARYHEIPNAGHLMNVDNSEAVTDLLSCILERTSR